MSTIRCLHTCCPTTICSWPRHLSLLQGVCHRDLKPENILLDDEDNVKITDFGLSKIVQFSEENGEGDGNHLVYTRCGTPRYMAPELLRRARDGYCGFKADIWSLGIILFAMLSGYLPFNGKNDDDLYNTVTTRDVYFPDFVPQDVRPLISQLLEKDPKKRIPLKQVREDPWFLIDYVEDDHVKDAKDKIKERCECGANNPSHNITSPRGEEMSPLSEVMVKKNTTDVNDSPTAPSSPVSSDGDEAPAATKERKKPAQLSVAVPSTNSSSALSPGGLKSPVVQRILSPTGAKDNTVAEDLINQHGLVNKVATVLTPRGKFMPSFLKGGDGSFRANREAAAGGDEDSIAPMTSEPSGAKRRHRLRVMTNSNARVSEASSKSRMRDNIAKVLSPRGGPGKQIPGGD
mmetsp:Transcript_6939/g.21109  ORF Transcript_6939/g.21109 Transcript_6939/m.21109 type:complete len:404 (-) Transcript_6939:83-1294(-)